MSDYSIVAFHNQFQSICYHLLIVSQFQSKDKSFQQMGYLRKLKKNLTSGPSLQKISLTTQRKEKAGAKLIDFVWYNGLWTSISYILALTIYLLPCARHRSNGLCFSP